MTAETDKDRIDRLTDALVEDVLNRSDEKVLDEAAAAYGHRLHLATQFDDVIKPILEQRPAKGSDEWMTFDLPSRPLAPAPTIEAAALDELKPPVRSAVPPEHPSMARASLRKISTRWAIFAALLITIVGLPSGYYVMKNQLQKKANTEAARKMQEIETETAQRMRELEQQKREVQQQRLALVTSIAESRQRAEDDRSKQQLSRGITAASPWAITSPSAIDSPSTIASPSAIASPPTIASPSTTASPSLTIRAPVQPKTGGNFVQLFFLAQHADNVQHALRGIQSQFPKQVKNTSVFLQADVGTKDHFYGVQIGMFETLERAQHACAALRRPKIQCVVQPSGAVAPPIGLGALVTMSPSAGGTPSPAEAAGPTPRVGGERGLK